MSNVPRRRVVLVGALLLGLVLVPRGTSPVRAGDPDVNGALAQQQQMEQKLAQQQATLTQLVQSQATLSASLQEIQDNLDAVGVAIDAAQTQLDALAAQIQLTQNQLTSLQGQIQSLQEDMTTIGVQITQNAAALQEREALLQEHLRAAYRESQVSVLEVLMSSQSFTDAAAVLGDMLTLSESDRQLADQIRQTREQLAIRKQTLSDGTATLNTLQQEAAQRADELATQQDDLQQAQAALDKKKAELQKLQQAQEAQLAATVANADAYRQRIAKQEAAIAGQQALVAQLEQQANALDIAYHGRFQWPLHGDFVVTQEFGPTQYEAFHTGIDIAYLTPICGGPVYAAADGTVLADGRPDLAYGDTAIGVIIGHSQRLQTWYWHLSKEIVSVGEVVQAGQLIGYEGATGWATGCHLHFQVMFDGQPVNPREYLP